MVKQTTINLIQVFETPLIYKFMKGLFIYCWTKALTVLEDFLGWKEVFENISKMEADSVNWDTIMELLPVGEGDDYEERVK